MDPSKHPCAVPPHRTATRRRSCSMRTMSSSRLHGPCLHVYTHVDTHVYAHVCAHVYARVCTYVCTHVHTHTFKHIPMDISARMTIDVSTHMSIHMSNRMSVHNKPAPLPMHTCACVCLWHRFVLRLSQLSAHDRTSLVRCDAVHQLAPLLAEGLDADEPWISHDAPERSSHDVVASRHAHMHARTHESASARTHSWD